jgi:hypothetical protein
MEAKVEVFKQILIYEETSEDQEINKLHNVKLVEFLLEKHIPYAAWWSGFTYFGIDLNANNGRLESKINEKKKQIGLGHQPDIYIDKSLDLIKGIIIGIIKNKL